MNFLITITDDQAHDLHERELATGLSMAQLIARAITDRLFNSPVEVRQVEEAT